MTPPAIPPFEILAELGRSSACVVYRARDPRLGREVVLKLLRFETERARKRLEREAKAMARLVHPGVVPLLELGDHEGSPYLVQPYVAGSSLAERIERGGPLPLAEVLQVGRELAEALGAVHALELLHRDVKPANVLLDEHGHALLTDFGLVKDTSSDSSEVLSLSVRGRFLGTPGFWPLEQARGRLELLGPSADVYGLGATLYAALSGVPPRNAESLQQALLAFDAPPQPLADLRPNTPRWLAKLIHACLSDDPARRPPLAEVMDRLARGRVPSEEPTPKPTWAPGLGIAAVICLLVVGIAVALTGESAPGAPAPDTTPPELELSAPLPEAVVAAGVEFELRGVARDDAGPVTVSLGAQLSRLEEDGSFTLRVSLEPGVQRVTVEATDAAGNARSKALRLKAVEVPAWFRDSEPARRPPLPLAAGLEWGSDPGDLLNHKDGTVLRWTPPGSATLGEADAPREVEFSDGFYLAKHETTWADYRAYCAAVGRAPPDETLRRGEWTWTPGPTHPVVNVEWRDALAYCEWARLRLPTADEWEYGARGTDGRSYPWGDAPPAGDRLNVADRSAYRAWLSAFERRGATVEFGDWDDGFPATNPVGAFAAGASPWGCLGMAGNVTEWVTEGAVLGSAEADPRLRAARGGSWVKPPRAARAAAHERAGGRSPAVGFRPARSR